MPDALADRAQLFLSTTIPEKGTAGGQERSL
jgi:hypothetical protein